MLHTVKEGYQTYKISDKLSNIDIKLIMSINVFVKCCMSNYLINSRFNDYMSAAGSQLLILYILFQISVSNFSVHVNTQVICRNHL